MRRIALNAIAITGREKKSVGIDFDMPVKKREKGVKQEQPELFEPVYTSEHYAEYKKSGNKNMFEEIIDKMMVESCMDETFKPYMEEIREIIGKKLPTHKKRFAILCTLDKNRNLLRKAKVFNNIPVSKMEHIKDYVKILRQYVKVSEVEKKKFGEVMTPIELVTEMLNKLPREVWSNPNLKWLEPCNGVGPFGVLVVAGLMKGLSEWEPDEDKRFKHIIQNMVYVCELQPKNMFLWMCMMDPRDEHYMNIYCGSFLDGGFDKHMKEVWGIEKFDVVVGNPPYNQMVDMDFVTKSYNISEMVMFVHPSTWLLDEKAKQKKFINTKSLIKDHLEKIILFNGNKTFGIFLFVPCVITIINKNKKSKYIKCIDKINKVEIDYQNIEDINKFSDLDVYTYLKRKIQSVSKEDNLLLHKNLILGNFYINTAQIRGNVDTKSEDKMLQDDFYTLITKDTVVSFEKNKHMFFSFKSNNEANNFLNFLKTNFCRFCLSLYKNNSQLDRGELEIIPWLDFSQEWNDEKLIKFFNLSEQEILFINKFIPKYY